LYATCLVLISLVFTVFWGKLFGIILTSMCLYFFSVWNSNYSCKKKLLNCKRYSKGSLWNVCSKWSTLSSQYHKEH
jgi:hypothetical protein